MAEGKKKHKFIKKATKNKGLLHEHLGVPEGEKIPEEKLRAALHSGNPTIRKEAVLARTLKGMHKHKGTPVKEKMKKMYGKKNG
jgi:hypothetical protein